MALHYSRDYGNRSDNMDFDSLSNAEVVQMYSETIKKLKQRGILRTNNVIGELGEFSAINYYNKTPGMPNLQAAPVGTQNIDAISREGERYSIKSTSGNTTGVFFGLQAKGSAESEKQKFEYVIICSFDENCELQGIYQLTWDMFLKHKHWHSRMQAWNLTLSKNLIADAKIIYRRTEEK
jgi:hypothetical protein